MRALFGLCALIGLAGLVTGILTIVRGAGDVPFSYENYGGPGAIIGGLVLLAVSLYLLSAWPRFEPRARATRSQ